MTKTLLQPEEQLPCHLTYTTPGVERVVRESLHLNCHIQQDTKGPRYAQAAHSDNCPGFWFCAIKP